MGDACPCGGASYEACCAPFHRGAEPPDAERLMRSRYAAFVRGELEHLWRTLHPDHDDRARPRAEWEAELRATLPRLDYRGLRILDTAPPDADGVARVLFHVTLREKRRAKRRPLDRSFAELSLFAHDGTGWRYLHGDPRPTSTPPTTIDRWR